MACFLNTLRNVSCVNEMQGYTQDKLQEELIKVTRERDALMVENNSLKESLIALENRVRELKINKN